MFRNNRLKIASCLALLCPISGIAAGGLNGMKMYVFEQQNDADSTVTMKTIQGNGGAKNLKMAVFDGGAASASLPLEHGRTIGIPADEQPPVVLDKYPRKQQPEDEMQIKTYGELGYRHDTLKYNIAGPTGTPNILSELQWNNVQSAVISGGSDITFAKNWQAEGKISYGKIAAGQNQDSDYILNNRQGEFSRSNNAADDGMSVNLSADLGYHLTLGLNNRAPYWRFTPKAGYAFHTQQFNNTQGVQTISDPTVFPDAPPLGNFSGLDSTYEGAWFGPWGGLTTQLAFTERFSLQAAMEYHWVDYQGTGHWNLRSDLQQPVSFKHKAGGEGIVASAVARYLLTPDWIVRLSAEYQGWQANNNGVKTAYHSDGAISETPFNEVKWQSYGLNLGVEYAF